MKGKLKVSECSMLTFGVDVRRFQFQETTKR